MLTVTQDFVSFQLTNDIKFALPYIVITSIKWKCNQICKKS